MDSPIEFVPPTALVIRGQHLSYYVALGAILLAAYIFQSLQSSKSKHVEVPFYKASKMKWMFDAETLVRDSYNKVGHSL